MHFTSPTGQGHGDLMRCAQWPDYTANRLAYSPDGSMWAGVTGAQLLLRRGSEIEAPTPPVQSLFDVVFDHDLLVAPARFDLSTGSWDAALARKLADGLPPEAVRGFGLRAAAWDAAGNALLLAGEYRPPRGIPARTGWSGPDSRVVLAEANRTREVLTADASEPRTALICTDSFVGVGGQEIALFDRDSLAPITELADLPAVARILRLDPTGAMLAAGAADGTVAVWRTNDWSEVGRWHAHNDEAAALAWLPSGDLLTGGADGGVRIWSPTGSRHGETVPGAAVTAVAARPDGKAILVACGMPEPQIAEYLL